MFKIQTEHSKRSDSDSQSVEKNEKDPKYLDKLNLKNLSIKASQIYNDIEKNKTIKHKFYNYNNKEIENYYSHEPKLEDASKNSKNYKERIKEIENQIRQKYLTEKRLNNITKNESGTPNFSNKNISKIKEDITEIKSQENLFDYKYKKVNLITEFNADCNIPNNTKSNLKAPEAVNNAKNLEDSKISLKKINTNKNDSNDNALNAYLIKSDDIIKNNYESEKINTNIHNSNSNFINTNENRKSVISRNSNSSKYTINNILDSNFHQNDNFIGSSVDNYRKLTNIHEIYQKIKQKCIQDENSRIINRGRTNNNDAFEKAVNLNSCSNQTKENFYSNNEKIDSMNKTIDRLSSNLCERINSLNQKIQEEKLKSMSKINSKNITITANDEKIKNLIQQNKDNNKIEVNKSNDLINSKKLTPDFIQNIRKIPEDKELMHKLSNAYENNYQRDFINSDKHVIPDSFNKQFNLTDKNFYSNHSKIDNDIKNKTEDPFVKIKKLLSAKDISNTQSSSNKLFNFHNYQEQNDKNENISYDKTQNNFYARSNFANYDKIKLEKKNYEGRDINSRVFISKTLNNYTLESDIEDVTESIINFRHDISITNLDNLNDNRDYPVFDRNVNGSIDKNYEHFDFLDKNLYGTKYNKIENHNAKKEISILKENEKLESNDNYFFKNSYNTDNSYVAHKANLFLNVIDSIKNQTNEKNCEEKDQDLFNTNKSVHDIEIYYNSEKKAENGLLIENGSRRNLKFDKGESVNIFNSEEHESGAAYTKSKNSDPVDIKSFHLHFPKPLKELESSNVINIEIISKNLKGTKQNEKEGRKNKDLDLCHESNIEIVKDVKELEMNHTLFTNDRTKNVHTYNNDILQFDASNYFIDKSINSNAKDSEIHFTSLRKALNFDFTKNESIEIISSLKKSNAYFYQNLNETVFPNLNLLIKEKENFNLISNEATSTNRADSNLKAFSENKKMSEIKLNNNFNFTSTLMNNLNNDEIDNKPNDTNQTNLDNAFKFIENKRVNKKNEASNRCINNTYNYKTEINIGNNRYDESPSKTLSKIFKKYKANTDKKSKEHYRILKELKKYQEDEDNKELELSISNMSLSMEKNKSVNDSLNNSKNMNHNNNSIKNSSLRGESRSRSRNRSREESLVLDKSFESQLSDENDKKKDIKPILYAKIQNYVEKEVEFKNDTNKRKESSSITKEKLRDLISNNGIVEPTQDKNSDNFNSEQKDKPAKDLSCKISYCSAINKTEEYDEQDLFLSNIEQKINDSHAKKNDSIKKPIEKTNLNKAIKIEANGLNFYEKFSSSNNKNIKINPDSNNLMTPNFETNKLNNQEIDNSIKQEANGDLNQKNQNELISEFLIELEDQEENSKSNLEAIEEISSKNTRNKDSNKRLNKFDDERNTNIDNSEKYDSTCQSKSKKKVSFSNNHSVHTYSHDGKRRSNKDLLKILKMKKNKKLKSILKKSSIIIDDNSKRDISDYENKCQLKFMNYNTYDNTRLNGLVSNKENGSSDLDKGEKEISKKIALDKLNDLIKECEIDSPVKIDEDELKSQIFNLKDSINIKKFDKKKVNRKINFDNNTDSEANRNDVSENNINKDNISNCNSCENSLIKNNKMIGINKDYKSLSPINKTQTKISKANKNKDDLNLTTNDSLIQIKYKLINEKGRDSYTNNYKGKAQNKFARNKKDETLSELSDAGNKSDLSNISTKKSKLGIKDESKKLIRNKILNESITNKNAKIYNLNNNQDKSNEKNDEQSREGKSTYLKSLLVEKIKTPDRIVKKTNFENYRAGNNLKSNVYKNSLNVTPNDLSNNTICSISDFSKSPIAHRNRDNDAKKNNIYYPKGNKLLNKNLNNVSNSINKSRDSSNFNDLSPYNNNKESKRSKLNQNNNSFLNYDDYRKIDKSPQSVYAKKI